MQLSSSRTCIASLLLSVQFLISYGPRGGAAYLEEFGFVPDGDGAGGPAAVELELELRPEAQDRFRDDKEVLLQNV
jgi:hypothetical protein